MTITSDVGIAFSKSIDLSFINCVLSAFLNNSDYSLEHNGNNLYIYKDIFWDDKDRDVLSHFLNSVNDSDYLVVEACDGENSPHSETGCWKDNPWNLQREKASLCFIPVGNKII